MALVLLKGVTINPASKQLLRETRKHQLAGYKIDDTIKSLDIRINTDCAVKGP